MKITKFLPYIIVVFILSTCAYSKESNTGTLQINLIPMYGHPNIEKTPFQKSADKAFIETVTTDFGSRENASMQSAGIAWRSYMAGDYSTAMRRFNQSWLLNPNNYLAHWGFALLLFDEGKTDEAAVHYNKALATIDNIEDKPRLLADAARAPIAARLLSGEKRYFTKWYSGSLDLDSPRDFKAGEKLRLSIGGNASKIKIRFLPKGIFLPDSTAGLLKDVFAVPKSRLIEVEFSKDRSQIVHISVHGGPNPWGKYPLGNYNGPATLDSVEIIQP